MALRGGYTFVWYVEWQVMYGWGKYYTLFEGSWTSQRSFASYNVVSDGHYRGLSKQKNKARVHLP